MLLPQAVAEPGLNGRGGGVQQILGVQKVD